LMPLTSEGPGPGVPLWIMAAGETSFPSSCLGTHVGKLRFPAGQSGEPPRSPRRREAELPDARSQAGAWERGWRGYPLPKSRGAPQDRGNCIMILDAIRQARYKQPFTPFALRLTDGRTIPVPDWAGISIAPRRIVVIGEDESITMIDPATIEEVVYPTPAS
jgi:hypothetical protein